MPESHNTEYRRSWGDEYLNPPEKQPASGIWSTTQKRPELGENLGENLGK